jgi:hypothetical protein
MGIVNFLEIARQLLARASKLSSTDEDSSGGFGQIWCWLGGVCAFAAMEASYVVRSALWLLRRRTCLTQRADDVKRAAFKDAENVAVRQQFLGGH